MLVCVCVVHHCHISCRLLRCLNPVSDQLILPSMSVGKLALSVLFCQTGFQMLGAHKSHQYVPSRFHILQLKVAC
jgi:hypothetical protein